MFVVNRVLPTINLDNNSFFKAGKISDEVSNWHLAAEFQILYLTIAQSLPKFSFGKGLIFSQVLNF